MNACYVWRNDEVQVIPGDITCTNALRYGILDCFVVDATCTSPRDRYGRFQGRSDRDCYWQDEPIEIFPPEFRTHLLLLGVS